MPQLAASSLVDDLYAGTLDPEAWRRAICGIADILSANCAALLAFDPKDGCVHRDEGYRVEPSALESYRDLSAAHLDPRLAPMGQRPVLAPSTEGHLMPLVEWRRSGIFNEFLRKIDCAYFLCTWLEKTSSRLVAISFQASVTRGPFDDHDRERLKPFLPHISRALKIRDRLETGLARADSLALGLDQTTFGLMVLDESGRVMEANGRAETLLRHETSVSRDKDGVLRLSGDADDELRHWIHRGIPGPNVLNGAISVERPLRLPLSIILTKIPLALSGWLASSPHWIAFFFDPEDRGNPQLDLLSRDLGISQREAELVSLFAAGLRVPEVAVRLGISPHTVRTHLKSALQKTNTHSQAELIQRALRSPALAMYGASHQRRS